MKQIRVPVLVIGAGPAGLSAAREIAPHADVLVLERETSAGGVPRHCHHTGFGLRDMHRILMGPTYSKRLVQLALDAGATIMTSAMVTDWTGPKSVIVTTPQGRLQVDADAVVLATGARERPRTARRIPGDRAAGVFTTGQLQQAVHLRHQSVGRRAVVVGAELVSWSAVLTLRHAGCKTVMLTTEHPRPDSYAVVARAGQLVFGPKLRTSTRVVRVIGRGRVSGVEIEHLGTGAREVVACDTVIFTGDWIPDHELARSAGVPIDPGTLGPVADSALRTMADGVFAAGNLLHPVDTGDIAAIDGAHVAATVLRYVRGQDTRRNGVELRVDGPLKWVSPSFIRPADRGPARGRLLIWSNELVLWPQVVARQAGQVIARKRLPWPAAPGRVFRVPATILNSVDPDRGPVTISIG